jgi:hypothetical protein
MKVQQQQQQMPKNNLDKEIRRHWKLCHNLSCNLQLLTVNHELRASSDGPLDLNLNGTMSKDGASDFDLKFI